MNFKNSKKFLSETKRIEKIQPKPALYDLVHYRQGGELVELAKRAHLTKNFQLVDDVIWHWFIFWCNNNFR